MPVHQEREYLIVNAKVETFSSSFPIATLAMVEFEKEKRRRFLYLLEEDGEPSFYLSSTDIWDLFFVKPSDEVTEVLDNALFNHFAGRDLPSDYRKLLINLEKGEEADNLLLFLIALVRSPIQSKEELLSLGIGKYAYDIKIPKEFLFLEDED